MGSFGLMLVVVVIYPNGNKKNKIFFSRDKLEEFRKKNANAKIVIR